MRIPVNQPYTITTGFGVPDSNARFGRHSGIDYAGFKAGRPIYAPTNGMLMNQESPTGGNMVVIFDGKYYHRLMHNSSFSRGPGYVKEGEEVAKAGTTGLSTGVHCHWDINTQGIYPTSFAPFIDPNVWLKEGEAMSDDIWKKLDETNKRLDSIFTNLDNLYKIVNKEVNNLYKLLDETNKRLDKLEKK